MEGKLVIRFFLKYEFAILAAFVAFASFIYLEIPLSTFPSNAGLAVYLGTVAYSTFAVIRFYLEKKTNPEFYFWRWLLRMVVCGWLFYLPYLSLQFDPATQA